MRTWKDTIIRALRTFIQAALGYAAANAAGIVNVGEGANKAAIGGLVLSAIAAGLAALMNLPTKDLTNGIERSVAEKEVETVEDLPLAGQVALDEEIDEQEADNE